MLKHSITIAGHATSITLEKEFWRELKAIAKREKTTIPKLVAEIDRARVEAGRLNLSSAIRVYILEDCLKKIKAAKT